MASTGESTVRVVTDSQRIRHLTRSNRMLIGGLAVLAFGFFVLVIWVFMQSGTDRALRQDLDTASEVVNGLGAAVEAADQLAVGAFFAEDAFFEDPAAGSETTGRSAIQSMYGSFLSSASPIENTAIYVGPGFAVTEFVWTLPCTFAACSTAVFMEPIEVRGIVLHEIENGEIVRETDYIAYPRGPVLIAP